MKAKTKAVDISKLFGPIYAARKCGLSHTTLIGAIDGGYVPVHRTGDGKRFVTIADVRAYQRRVAAGKIRSGPRTGSKNAAG